MAVALDLHLIDLIVKLKQARVPEKDVVQIWNSSHEEVGIKEKTRGVFELVGIKRVGFVSSETVSGWRLITSVRWMVYEARK